MQKYCEIYPNKILHYDTFLGNECFESLSCGTIDYLSYNFEDKNSK